MDGLEQTSHPLCRSVRPSVGRPGQKASVVSCLNINTYWRGFSSQDQLRSLMKLNLRTKATTARLMSFGDKWPTPMHAPCFRESKATALTPEVPTRVTRWVVSSPVRLPARPLARASASRGPDGIGKTGARGTRAPGWLYLGVQAHFWKSE